MAGFPWFPIGHKLPGGSVGRLRQEGVGYQVILSATLNSAFLVLEKGSLVSEGAHRLLDPRQCGFHSCEFDGRSYLSRLFELTHEPLVLREWSKKMGLPTSSDATAIGKAVKRLREAFPNADVENALYLTELDECLPVNAVSGQQDLRPLAIEILVAGARIPSFEIASVRAINSWLTPEEIQNFLDAVGIRSAPGAILKERDIPLSIPGRPELENFFREYIIEPSLDRVRYKALGVKPPNGILLYGPPGSGKTHAVRKLRAALDWSTFEIDLGSLGSPFIHQTSVALRRTFDKAKRVAPALVLIEEIDALASSRGPMTNDHKLEEISELLRLVEGASENGILVVATTNHHGSLDRALLRKGRFDHSIEVGYPTTDEVAAALNAMLSERPHREVPNLSQVITRLTGRPMSDVAWVVNEAARVAARGRKDAIDEIDLFSALKRLKT